MGKASKKIVLQKLAEANTSIKLPQTTKKPIGLETPKFVLECCHDKDNCLGTCKEQKNKIGFANTIHKLCQMTWLEIINTSRQKSGCETLNFLRKKLPHECKITDDTDIVGLKYYKNKRIVGYIDGDSVFHIVWVEVKGLYDHGS
ncbi:MAG TPA: hypothetical protein DCR59_02075 [Dehalococcoidia bacterium]|nr:hypothetical protein [Dehalococcoidia bacterium]